MYQLTKGIRNLLQISLLCAQVGLSGGVCSTQAQSHPPVTSTVPNNRSSSSTRTTRVFSVVSYGARGDGSLGIFRGHDDTNSIQTAIDAACSAGGGTVKLPKGIYNIALQSGTPPRPTSGTAALSIPCNNVVLGGSGTDSTTINFWLIEEGKYVAPSSICPKNVDVQGAQPPRVWRGSAIYIPGGKSPSSPAKNIEIRDLRLTGNAEINGDNKNPVVWDPNKSTDQNSKCNAWDTSNKGIYLQNNDFSLGPRGMTSGGYYPPIATYFDNIHIVNVHVDHFLGELIYDGNRTVLNSTIESSELDHSNGDCISVAGGWTITNNYCHDVSAIGFENSPGFAPQSYVGNKIKRVKLDGIAITNVVYNSPLNQEYGPVSISKNEIENAERNGIVLYDTVHATVSNNSITDSSVGISLYDMGTSLPAPMNHGARPAEPTIVLDASGKEQQVYGPTYRVSICWVYGGTTPFDQVSRSLISSSKSLPSIPAVIKAPALDSTGSAKPTGWEVYAGIGDGPLYRQGGTISLGSDFRLSKPLNTSGISEEMLEGIPAKPTSPPSVEVRQNGKLQSGLYEVRFSWMSRTSLGYLLSSLSPSFSLVVDSGQKSMIVNPNGSAPHNAIGFVVFVTRQEEPLKKQSSNIIFSKINDPAVLSELTQAKSLQLPNSGGAILSPNVHDIAIVDNLFSAAQKSMHAGVQCCGTPIAWPMVTDITIRGNIFHDMDKEHRVERPVATPPEFSLPSGAMGPSRTNFQVMQR